MKAREAVDPGHGGRRSRLRPHGTAPHLPALGLPYVTRIQPEVYVQCSTYRGRLERLRGNRGTQRLLGKV